MTPLPNFIEILREKESSIYKWIKEKELCCELPLYTSVDIRSADFKLAVVDTNLFPAGFNNLCHRAIEDSSLLFKNAIKNRIPNGKNILIIAEEHTRNKWYLENIRILELIIQEAGYNTKIATFLFDEPEICKERGCITLETAVERTVDIYCLSGLLKSVEDGSYPIDLIILNNDLTTGIPEMLKNTDIPIYPSLHSGWHSRLKSYHFGHVKTLTEELAELIGIDPWFLSCLHSDGITADITVEEDREQLKNEAAKLFARIQEKYDEYDISEKPYIILKADAGTYGMGVIPIEHPDDILALNRKARNKLSKGKSSKSILQFFLQEGVPSTTTVDNFASEACIYQIDNNFAGGFYRINTKKSSRDNLNSSGMVFKKMCSEPTCIPSFSKGKEDSTDCGVSPDPLLDIYQIIARLAGIAAQKEVAQLEQSVK
jgi:glutamate--cysteine ligase